jgi:hypothetical protein
MGGAGMFAVSLYMMIMGKYYDGLIQTKLPANASLADYANATDPAMISTYNAAKTAAGPAIINVTLIIPIVLAVAFAGLNVYMKTKKKTA